MSRYFTTHRWIEVLRGLPPHGALLHSSAIPAMSGLDESSARQAAWRLGKAGLLTHLGAGWYTHAFAKLSIDEAAAVLAGRPSYISLESALLRHHVTTQSSVDLTCVTMASTQSRDTPLGAVSYRSISDDLFWGFEKTAGVNGLYVFEAWPEKALLDLIYLSRRQGEPVWLDLDFSKFDAKRLSDCAKRFPRSVARQLDELRETRLLVA